MWMRTFLTLLSVEVVAASQCWQGATFSEAVVSPTVGSSGILRVPGVSTLPQCVAACCDLPGYDLAWLFEGRCFILSCQPVEDCQPQERPGADSILAFLHRGSPQKFLLQSLVRGEPYGNHWRSRSRSSEAPGDLEDLKNLGLFEGPQRDLSDPGVVDYAGGSQENQPSERKVQSDQPSVEERDNFNHSNAEKDPEQGMEQTRAVSVFNNLTSTWKDKDRTLSLSDLKSTGQAQSTTESHQQDNQGTSTTALTTPSSSSSRHSSSISSTRLPTSEVAVPSVILTENFASKTNAGVTTDMMKATTTQTMTSNPNAVTAAPTSSLSPAPLTTAPPTAAAAAVPVGGASSRGPVAIVGPDRKLVLPLTSLLLNGTESTAVQGIVSYHWDTISGPPGLKMEGADQAVAKATGLKVGRYTFRLTVSDQQGAKDSASLTVRVQEAVTLPPVAHASGSHTLTLPDNAIILRGAITDGDQSKVQFLWVRDNQSPAAGDVLYGSETQASLYLCNLVEGTYLFHLRVTDAQGRSSSSTATVEVRPEPGEDQQVELEMMVAVSQVSLSQKDTVIRQLAALLHVVDSDVHVRALEGHAHLSTVLRFVVADSSQTSLSASALVHLLRKQLLADKNDFLLFRVLRVDTVSCLLRCSGRGQCDPITKTCSCDPFWTENLIRRYLGDGESNCEWRVLYVILTSFLLMVLILSVSWTFVCCRSRRQSKVRKKTKYTILDNMDEQERVELRPKFSIKHRSTEHNSSLMMSESELDSDQDTIFSRDRPVRSRNRVGAQANRNGNAFG